MNIFSKLLIIGITFLGITNSSFALPKTVRFATEAAYPPFVSLSPSLQFEGFEVELIKAMCLESSLNCTFSHLPFDSLFLSLSLKKIDVVFGGIAITEDRKKQVFFSNPLYVNTVGLVFLNTNPVRLESASVQGKTIAVQQGSTFEYYLQEKYAGIVHVKTYASIQDALLDLSTTRVDAVFGDLPVLNYWLKTNKQKNYQTFELTGQEAQAFSAGNALAVRKEDAELIKVLNQALEKIKNNGAYEKIKSEWLEQNHAAD